MSCSAGRVQHGGNNGNSGRAESQPGTTAVPSGEGKRGAVGAQVGQAWRSGQQKTRPAGGRWAGGVCAAALVPTCQLRVQFGSVAVGVSQSLGSLAVDVVGAGSLHAAAGATAPAVAADSAAAATAITAQATSHLELRLQRLNSRRTSPNDAADKASASAGSRGCGRRGSSVLLRQAGGGGRRGGGAAGRQRTGRLPQKPAGWLAAVAAGGLGQ